MIDTPVFRQGRDPEGMAARHRFQEGTSMKRLKIAALAAAFLFSTAPAMAQEAPFPFKDGSYWNVSAIHVKDGKGVAYAKHLANSWTVQMDFAKKNGWVKDYHILTNEYPRDGEPSLYLVTIFDSMASPEENEKRAAMYRANVKKSMEQLAAESGQRTEMRTVGSQSLLREQIKR